jgi:hypothetical protein
MPRESMSRTRACTAEQSRNRSRRGGLIHAAPLRVARLMGRDHQRPRTVVATSALMDAARPVSAATASLAATSLPLVVRADGAWIETEMLPSPLTEHARTAQECGDRVTCDPRAPG